MSKVQESLQNFKNEFINKSEEEIKNEFAEFHKSVQNNKQFLINTKYR